MFRNKLRNTNSAFEWGYGAENGPDTWAKAWPIAEEGQRQSPIALSWAAPQDPSLNKPRLMVNMSLIGIMIQLQKRLIII